VRFSQEFWLYLVPLVPLLWLVFRAADRRTAERLKALLGENAEGHVEGFNRRLQGWRRFFFLAGIFWLLLALARPQWGANEVSVTQRGSDIVIALDISNSMLAEDVLPNRMGRAITELTSFLNRLEDSRVGLVFFAGSAFVQCPLTLDYGTAEIFLRMAGPDMMSQQGTAIASALETSRVLLDKGRPEGQKNNFQAILLVTDGEDLEGKWEEQAEACKRGGIKVIPVGVGDKGGGLIPAFDTHGRPDGFMKDEEGNVVMTRLDLVSLEKMAGIGGGSSFLIGVDGLAGDRLFAELQRLGKRDLEDRRISSFKERYVWPLMLALICFVLRLGLHARRPNRAKGSFPTATGAKISMAMVLLIPLLLTQSAEAALRPVGGKEAMAGRDFFLAGDFENALDKFEEALIQAPEDPLISLALGETLHHLERFEEAGVEFERALDLAEDPVLKAEALYNLGTTRLANDQIDKAAEDLLASLQWDPNQADALHNLEVALQRIEQQQQQEQEQQEDQENKDGEKQEDQQQEKQDGQQDQEDQQEQDQQQEDQKKEEQDQEQNQDQQNEEQQQENEQQQSEDQEQSDQDEVKNPDEMTKEQALQLLQALDKDEEELKRSVQKRLQGGRPKSGKKW